MQTVQVKSIPINEVIKDIAKLFEVDYQEFCGEYMVEIPTYIGKGVIKGISFAGGLGVIFYNCTFFEDTEIQFNIDSIHPVKFLFCTEGTVYHRFDGQDKVNKIGKFQNAIVANKGRKGHIIQFKANQPMQMNSLEIIRSKFQDRLICDLKHLDADILKLFQDQQGKNLFYYEGYYSLIIAKLFNEIEMFSQDRFLWHLFMEGKTHLILVQQIIQYKDDLNEGENKSILRQSDIKLIQESSKYIYNNLSILGTIEDIAKEVGMSSGKLQSGFKELYGTTVNEYIQNSRLKVAITLLAETELSLYEIQDKIGLSSKSYFSKIFKDYFGISPSKFREDNKNKLLQNRKRLSK
ncbi:helix-turn-helix transcriptional regulator [Galbibacter orientalis]|uniref:helix-turn-helix domain-containing protein n=1 Tax=Galbibacter orientalis TaxID=453852 RepID=UPI003080BC0C